MKNKKMIAVALTTAMTATMAVGMATTVSAADYTIKLCTEQTDGDPIDDGCDKWAELVAEATDGAVEIQVYPSSQLGAKADLIEMALAGQGVCTIADGSYLMDYVPDLALLWDRSFSLTGIPCTKSLAVTGGLIRKQSWKRKELRSFPPTGSTESVS